MAQQDKAAQEKDKATPYAYYGLSVLTIIYVLNFIDRQILSILANDIKADLHLTDADLGFLYGTAFAVFYALFGIPLGRLADNWHRVKLLTIGLTLWSAMTALSGFARNFGTLTSARIGVGVGEATAGPSAYSLISDWFPKRMRATAIGIYSTGVYIGVGFSTVIGAQIVGRWNAAYPHGGPLGLVGWQAAFMIVGIPGLLLALLAVTLREPVRGKMDGLPTPPSDRPFADFWQDLLSVIPPLTLFGAARAGGNVLRNNVIGAGVIAVIAYGLYRITGSGQQWLFVGVGYYAIFSWVLSLRVRDPSTYALIWRNPAFLCMILGYGCISFFGYAVSYWGAPYAERVLGISKTEIGLMLGAPNAVAGFIGLLLGGAAADWLRVRNPAGRIIVIIFGLLAALPPLYIALHTNDKMTFFISIFLFTLFNATALAPTGATTQDLVLPRMRGTAVATFYLATTMFGLALGPYLAGLISTRTGNLGLGIMSTTIVVPFSLILLCIAYKLVPAAERNMVERARAAGEEI
jgi:MFS family permease